MRVEPGQMVSLGYGKFIRSQSIVGLVPIEEGRGPGRRTLVHVEDLAEPLVASRSETAILRDLSGSPEELLKAREHEQLLADILDTIEGMNPILRSIVRDQARWDLDRLEERIRETLPADR
jgi:hypothetical protein